MPDGSRRDGRRGRNESGGEGARVDFPRSVRLRRSIDFQRTQRTGRRIRRAHVLVIAAPCPEGKSRYGLTVSRKVGNAVTRNRVKRRLREVLRHARGSVEGAWDVVVIAHPEAATAPLEVLRQEVASALRTLGR